MSVQLQAMRVSPWATPGGVGLLHVFATSIKHDDQHAANHADGDDPAYAAASDALSRCLIALCGKDTPPGAVSLRSFFSELHPGQSAPLPIDHGLVARLSPASAMLMPHGGLAVLRELEAAITRIMHANAQPHSANALSTAHDQPASHTTTHLSSLVTLARHLFPEARSVVEALALHALTRATSPLAVDVLLWQHEAWSLCGASPHTLPTTPSNADPSLKFLLSPPTIALFGAANIGKSTLLNALAAQRVSIIANEAGTTRDHVGALINFAGLSALVVDTPGMRTTSDPAEHAAREVALRIVANADLVLHCIDSADDLASERTQLPPAHNPAQRVIRVMLRSDLGTSHHAEHCDVALGNLDGQSEKASFGLDVLVARVRETLVPSSALRDPVPWSFWL